MEKATDTAFYTDRLHLVKENLTGEKFAELKTKLGIPKRVIQVRGSGSSDTPQKLFYFYWGKDTATSNFTQCSASSTGHQRKQDALKNNQSMRRPFRTNFGMVAEVIFLLLPSLQN